MVERTVSLTCVAAIGLWVLTLVLIFTGSLVAIVSDGGQLPTAIALLAHGLASSAAAATMSIRMMIRKQNNLLRDAFRLGEDRGAGGVRAVR